MKKSGLSVLMAGLLVLILSEQAFPQQGNIQKQTSSKQIQHLDSLKRVASAKQEADFTVPSFTILKKAIGNAANGTETDKIKTLEEALKNLQAKEIPYSIVANINGNPTTGMAFNWFTNAGITGGKIQIIEGVATDSKQFTKPLKTVNAKVDQLKELNYSVKSNSLSTLAGIPDNTKKTYTSNKAFVNGLSPNTAYSYRVGTEGKWSKIGTFKTAPSDKSDFSFLYTTDPQANNDGMFNISQKTTHAAQRMYPDVSFFLPNKIFSFIFHWLLFLETTINLQTGTSLHILTLIPPISIMPYPHPREVYIHSFMAMHFFLP
jgi:hypothetical protein